jgi:hypothetical protein
MALSAPAFEAQDRKIANKINTHFDFMIFLLALSTSFDSIINVFIFIQPKYNPWSALSIYSSLDSLTGNQY